MANTINLEMKKTLFEISLKQIKSKRKTITPKSAGKIIRKYHILMHTEVVPEITGEMCDLFAAFANVSTPEQIFEYLTKMYCSI